MSCSVDNLTLASCQDCQLELSTACLLQHKPDRNLECFPHEPAIARFAGVWCAANAAFGSTGNALTLLAIPFAIRRRRFGLRYHCTHVFVLNLALADFLYCSLNLPTYAMQYLAEGWPLSEELCYALTSFRWLKNIFAGFLICTVAHALAHV